MKRSLGVRWCAFAVFFTGLSTTEAQLIIPQIADGGGWQTTLVLTNTSATAASASISFFQETSGGNTQAWNPSFLETSATQNVALPAAGTLFLHSAATAAVTSVGWAQIQAPPSVSAYAIFTQRASGRTDQDGTAQAAAGAARILIPFDNTAFVTSIGLANPGTASESISVAVQPSSGPSSQLSAITLPAQGHMAFGLPQQFPATAGRSGLLELYSASGTLSALALRFNATGGFTTAPVYPVSGSPIIVTGGGSTGGGSTPLPAFSQIEMRVTFNPTGAPSGFASMQISPENGLSTFGVSQSNSLPVFVHCTGSNGNHTFSCNMLPPGIVVFFFTANLQVVAASASMTVTLSDPTINTETLFSGTISGTMTISGTIPGTSTPITLSGSMTGPYYLQTI